jgi:hypothetical protein
MERKQSLKFSRPFDTALRKRLHSLAPATGARARCLHIPTPTSPRLLRRVSMGRPMGQNGPIVSLVFATNPDRQQLADANVNSLIGSPRFSNSIARGVAFFLKKVVAQFGKSASQI